MPHPTTQETMDAYLQALLKREPIAAFFTPDVTFSVMGGDQVIRGAAEVEAFIGWFHTVAFDARPDIKATYVDVDHAALEADFVGRHTGEFFGVPASQHDVRVPYVVVYDLVDGKIAALRFYMPMNALMEQIGPAVSPAVTAA